MGRPPAAAATVQQLRQTLPAFGQAARWAVGGARGGRDARRGTSSGDCLLCCEPVRSGSVFECSRHHKLCNTCLSRFIIENWRDLDDAQGGGGNQRRTGELRCCVPSCQSEPASMEKVIRFASREALAVYMGHVVRMREAQCFEEALTVVQAKAPDAQDVIDALFERQLQRSMPRARMCPHCKFGPIDFHGCDDLLHHHQERRSGGATVSNACPRCGFFTRDIKDWLRWDGSLVKQDDPVTPWPDAAAAARRTGMLFDDNDDDDTYYDDDEDDDDDDDDDDGGWMDDYPAPREAAMPRTVRRVAERVQEILPSARMVDLASRIINIVRETPRLNDDELVSVLIESLLTEEDGVDQ